MRYKVLVMLTALVSSATWATDSGSLIEQGNEAWVAHDLPLAESKFRAAVTLESESAAASARLANFLLLQNRNLEAIEAYQTAITLDPEDAGLFVGIAIAYLHDARYSSANAMVAQALRLNPELENAQKLALYIEKKQQQIAEQDASATDLSTSHPLPAAHSMPK